MSNCFASGGPDWLFTVMLIAGFVALGLLALGLVPTLQHDEAASHPRARSPYLLLPIAAVAVPGLALGAPLSDTLTLLAEVLVGSLAMAFLGRHVGTLTTGTTVERSRAKASVVLGGLAGMVALAAAVAMIVLGRPC